MTPALPVPHPSIVHALLVHAERGSDAAATIFVPDRGADPDDADIRWRHDDLVPAACRAATVLAEAGVGEGDRVLLGLPTSPDFLTAFFGALVLGAIPTATAPPGGFGSAEVFHGRVRALLGYLRPAAVIAPGAVSAAAELPAGVAAIDGAVLHAAATDPATPARAPRLPAPSDTAFIQATSGSTGTPKGVRVTPANQAA
ncbi:AMP-binding protein, partial [Nocardia farcinica]|uniref:AMP-binding protein n=1 Tax=Nocardia farcinica TaxID=37329 RepID=UPI002456645A